MARDRHLYKSYAEVSRRSESVFTEPSTLPAIFLLAKAGKEPMSMRETTEGAADLAAFALQA
jgi:hypothetical protein